MKDFSNFHFLDNETDEVKNTINAKWGIIENFYYDLYLVYSRDFIKYYISNYDISKIKELYESTGAVSNFDDIGDAIKEIVNNEVLSKNKDHLF